MSNLIENKTYVTKTAIALLNVTFCPGVCSLPPFLNRLERQPHLMVYFLAFLWPEEMLLIEAGFF